MHTLITLYYYVSTLYEYANKKALPEIAFSGIVVDFVTIPFLQQLAIVVIGVAVKSFFEFIFKDKRKKGDTRK